MESIVDLLKTIMGSPIVEQGQRDQASDLLKKLSPKDHPANKDWRDVFRDRWGLDL
ncbi:MAG: hypothetical protein ACK4Z5_12105 [Brevundimonas sp.]